MPVVVSTTTTPVADVALALLAAEGLALFWEVSFESPEPQPTSDVTEAHSSTLARDARRITSRC